MQTMPPEVKQYFDSGVKHITSVVANPNYTLTLTFDNGETRLYDMREAVEKKPFAQIKHKFQDAFLNQNGCVAWDIDSNLDSSIEWDNQIDICSDKCYIYSQPIQGEL